MFASERYPGVNYRTLVELGSSLSRCILKGKMREERNGGTGRRDGAMVVVRRGAVDYRNDGVVEVGGILFCHSG